MESEGVENIGGWFLIFFCFGFVYGVYYFSVVRQPPRPIEWGSGIVQQIVGMKNMLFPHRINSEELETLNQSKADLESATTVTGFGIGDDEDD